MLKEYREKNNLIQREMADMLKINVACYSRYENRKRKMSYKVLIRFLEIRNEENDKILINLLKSI